MEGLLVVALVVGGLIWFIRGKSTQDEGHFDACLANAGVPPSWLSSSIKKAIIRRVHEDGRMMRRMDAKLGDTTQATMDRWTGVTAEQLDLGGIASVLAEAFDPERAGTRLTDDPKTWAYHKRYAEWVIPLLDAQGVEHRFQWPAFDPDRPTANSQRPMNGTEEGVACAAVAGPGANSTELATNRVSPAPPRPADKPLAPKAISNEAPALETLRARLADADGLLAEGVISGPEHEELRKRILDTL